eukprot:TRINITY_DN2042_c0_g2_i1.p1 TRINITY_DN2042_c0_g2~~TRINITY_DN2042_c0_g2_i1.p1  ORF type:complete len:373 (+),score=69.41 TRINITY_DN2042_c0_g2_i1:53-1171(+)
MSTFNCNTCGVSFEGRDAMKAHYSGDLHRENVKRRVNGLVPLSQAALGARTHRTTTSMATTGYKCKICDKRFATPQTLGNHMQSKQHRDKKAKYQEAELRAKVMAELEAEEDEETEESLESSEESANSLFDREPWEATAEKVGEEDKLTATDCLFCCIRAPDAESNLCHMAKAHNFTLPLADNVTDVEGLLEFLALKLNACVCLVCGLEKRQYDTRRACQDHMQAAGHNMIKLNDEDEYREFYDSTVPFDKRAPIGEGATADGTIVLKSGATIKSNFEYKSHQAPIQLKPNLTAEEAKEQKLLTMQTKGHHTVVAMNRYRDLLDAREKLGKKERNIERQAVRNQQKQRMRLGVHLNCLHGKGYQGDYVGKTI